jgi:transcriptional regulator with XRE-family HTH domain
MTRRERPIDRGRRLAQVDRVRIGDDIRTARMILGRSLEEVGPAAGMSPSQAGRIERAVLETASIDQLARLGAVVGIDVRVRSYPGPDPVRDARQIALLERLQGRLHPDLVFRAEVPLPLAGDQRAWDGMIRGWHDESQPLPVEGETRLIDLQAQVRRITLKLRDSGLAHVLVVVSETRQNREALVFGERLLTTEFPISPRHALAALAAGRHPGGSALVLL